MDLKETDILGQGISNHWYYRSKARAMTELLGPVNGKTILDIGAGSGFFSKYLLYESRAKEAWCVDISYEKDFDEMADGNPIHFRKSVDSVKAEVVLLMDVLEHVDDDVALLKDYAAKVPKGAFFLISVPAFNFLWSGHDVFLEHKRRYTLNEIEKVTERAGLTLKSGAYYFGAVFPLAASIRMMGKLFGDKRQPPRSQLKMHHPLINGSLAALSRAEAGIMKHNRLAGLTAFCLAQYV
ncbi:methyltransferase (plasmid) [Deltaproteobacteria bacterium Smac51]|nr:methyltransferase [Deltaproteobacteria bacterium Smac51]